MGAEALRIIEVLDLFPDAKSVAPYHPEAPIGRNHPSMLGIAIMHELAKGKTIWKHIPAARVKEVVDNVSIIKPPENKKKSSALMIVQHGSERWTFSDRIWSIAQQTVIWMEVIAPRNQLPPFVANPAHIGISLLPPGCESLPLEGNLILAQDFSTIYSKP